MRIQDFEKADCNLLRPVTISIEGLERRIDNRLLSAWNSGQSAANAVNAVINNSALLDELTQVIEERVRLKRTLELHRLSKKGAYIISQLNEEQEAELQMLSSSYAGKESELEAIAQETQQRIGQTHQAYSAAHAKIQTLQERIQKRLESVGGSHGLRRLQTIVEVMEPELQGSGPMSPLDPSSIKEIEISVKRRSRFYALFEYARTAISKIMQYKTRWSK
jgi:hypothetical protein